MEMEYRVGLEQSRPSKSDCKVPVHMSYYSKSCENISLVIVL